MDAIHSQHLSRISRLLLVAIGVAFAWVLLSFTLGVSQAHADETDDGGLLGAVGAVVDGTTEVVADTAVAASGLVTDTAAAAVQVVTPVVQEVSDAVPFVAPVVDVVEAGGTAVTDLTGRGVLTPLVDPALGLVRGVPVVGTLVSALGVDSAVSTGAAGVDAVLHQTTTGLVGTVSGVIQPPDGTVAVPPLLPPRGAGEAIVPPTSQARTVAATPFDVLARAAFMTGASTWLSLTSGPLSFVTPSPGAASDDAVSAGATGGFDLLRSVLQADSVLMGSAGAGPGAWVLLALGLVVAHRAWVRRAGLENDVAPPAPVLSTDVSPD